MKKILAIIPCLAIIPWFQGCTAEPAPPAATESPAAETTAEPPEVAPQTSGVDASLRGVAVWDANTVWASGTSGTVIRSNDVGVTWEQVVVPGAEELDFRDIQFLDDATVLLMSVGNGGSSRIYKTTDGGVTWRLALQNADEKAFFNGLAFWDEQAGVLTSDSPDGHPYLLLTEDGGESWRRVGEGSLPPLIEGEYGFAASGTGVAARGGTHVWIATGGAVGRVFHSADRGVTWEVADTPIGAGTPSSGIFSIAMRDTDRGVVVGGDYQDPDVDRGNAAYSNDAGRTWHLAERPGGLPQKAAVVYLGQEHYLTAGRTGLAFSQDDGASWTTFSTSSYYAIGYDPASGVGWLVGADGHVARFVYGGA